MWKIVKEKKIFEWFITILIITFMMLIFTYVDHVSLVIWSTNIWDCLWNGDLERYYFYTAENIHGLAHINPDGSMVSLIPFAIWNIPIWIAQYFFGVEITQSVPCLFWSKLFSCLVAGVLLEYVYKICMHFWNDSKRSKLVLLLCVSSVYFHMGVSYAGQNDILWIMLGTVSVYYYLIDRKFPFVLFANLSIIVKPYFFITYIALILLKEKRIYKIIRDIFLALIGYVTITGIHIISTKVTGFVGENENTKKMFREYFSNVVNTPYGEASILIILIAVLYVGCYILTFKDLQRKKDGTIYLICLINVCWCVISYENFYRIIMVLPWLYILLLNYRGMIEVNLWLDVLLSFTWFGICINTGGTIFDSFRGMSPSILKVSQLKPYEYLDKGTLYLMQMDFFNARGGYETFIKLLNGVWIGLIIAILIINFPPIASCFERNHDVVQSEKIINLLVWLHVIMIIPFILLACFKVTGII